MTAAVKVTMTDPVSGEVFGPHGPCSPADADQWAQRVQAAHRDDDLACTVERAEETP